MQEKTLKKKLRKTIRMMFYIFLALFLLSMLLPLLYRWVNPPFTPLMLSRKITMNYSINHQWVDIEDISPSLIECAVAAEDNRYLGHNGLDFGAIQKALDERERGRFRGASTISQQTAKNIFLWQGKSWLRKGLEVYFTFLIETFWSKERIMEVYLNEIEMGKGIYGAEAAAQHYFKKHARHLSRRQSSLIVAAFPNPLQRNPAKPTAYLSKRADAIASLSLKIGAVKFDKDSIKRAQERYKEQEDKRKKKIE